MVSRRTRAVPRSYPVLVRLMSDSGTTRPAVRVEAELFERAAIGMAVVGLDGRLQAVNPRLAQMLGRTPGDLSSSNLLDVTHPEDWWPVRQALAEMDRDETREFRQRQRCLAAGGAIIWADLVLGVTPRRAGMPGQCLAQLIDVTAEVTHLQTLEAAVRHSKVLSENSRDIVAQTDPQGVILWVSPSITRVLGWEPSLITGNSLAALVPQQEAAGFTEQIASVRDGADIADAVLRVRSTSGAYRYMSVSARPLFSDDDLVTGIAVGMRDVTEELRAKRELARSEEQFRLAMQGAPEGMAVTDGQDRIVQANPALSDLLGVDVESFVGHRVREYLPAEDRDVFESLLSKLQQGDVETVRVEHRLISTLGEVWVDHAVGILRDERGRPQLFVHQFADRTETRRMQADLQFRATHDAQTGLPNKASLKNRLEERLGVRRQPSDKVGILFVDIDNLKPINDELGHHVGDEVIAAVAARLQSAVRRQDAVARYGGDEFVMLIDEVSTCAELALVANTVHTSVGGPVDTDDAQVLVTVSIGAAMADASTDPDVALRRADEALYRAKRSGRNLISIDCNEQDHSPAGPFPVGLTGLTGFTGTLGA